MAVSDANFRAFLKFSGESDRWTKWTLANDPRLTLQMEALPSNNLLRLRRPKGSIAAERMSINFVPLSGQIKDLKMISLDTVVPTRQRHCLLNQTSRFLKGKLMEDEDISESKRQVGAQPRLLERLPVHYKEWIDACKGGKRASSNIVDHIAHLAEVVLLVNITIHINY
jgi:hypothetical protein